MPCTDFNLVELWAGLRKEEEAVTKREDGHLLCYDGPHATAALTLCSCANDEVLEKCRGEKTKKIKHQNYIRIANGLPGSETKPLPLSFQSFLFEVEGDDELPCPCVYVLALNVLTAVFGIFYSC